jgi:hypothetical protein
MKKTFYVSNRSSSPVTFDAWIEGESPEEALDRLSSALEQTNLNWGLRRPDVEMRLGLDPAGLSLFDVADVTDPEVLAEAHP